MSAQDLVIIGGGLSGALTLAGICHHHPRLNIRLLEKEQTLGGNHTWCFHDHDIPAATRPWLLPLISKTWDSYEVKFPRYNRVLRTAYHCIKSEDLHQKLMEKYAAKIQLGTQVRSWQQNLGFDLQLATGKSLSANGIIDARGWVHPLQSKKVAWQKFVGLEIKLKKPHGLSRVILKDVRIPQIDGYRFFYTLPFSEDTLLVEDTYYSNHSILKVERIQHEVEKYIQDQGWEIEVILRREVGCLPLTLYADQQPISETSIGAASLYFNPVTGYTFPQTIRCLQALLEKATLTQESMSQALQQARRSQQKNEKYFRLLNRMMFLAAEPSKRYVILERFYQLNEDLIQRFYSAELKKSDQLRILWGKPPVPIFKALKVFRENQ